MITVCYEAFSVRKMEDFLQNKQLVKPPLQKRLILTNLEFLWNHLHFISFRSWQIILNRIVLSFGRSSSQKKLIARYAVRIRCMVRAYTRLHVSICLPCNVRHWLAWRLFSKLSRIESVFFLLLCTV